jgi:hypothetical protein
LVFALTLGTPQLASPSVFFLKNMAQADREFACAVRVLSAAVSAFVRDELFPLFRVRCDNETTTRLRGLSRNRHAI